jgi:deoxycytidylate deaminase
VGAVIIDTLEYSNQGGRSADVVAVGMNEVPCPGGGHPWDQTSPDNRDQVMEDRARKIKKGVLAELIEKIKEEQWLNKTIASKETIDLADELVDKLKGTQFLNIGEFGRTVHGEMAALIDAARRGVSVQGHSMYVTTFPCHNCAKHIIAAGIKKVIYLEPYPKSRTKYLYDEDVSIDALPGKEQDGKVAFFPFTGIAPRQYRQLFSMSMRGGKKGNLLEEWKAAQQAHLLAPLYVPQKANLLYLEQERDALKDLPDAIYSRLI